MCTTSMSMMEINRRLDAPSDYYKASSPSSISDMEAGDPHQHDQQMNDVGKDAGTGKPSHQTNQPEDSSPASPVANESAVLASDGRSESSSAGVGGINADMTPAALTTSSSPRKRRWSDVNEAACVDESSPKKRVHLGEHPASEAAQPAPDSTCNQQDGSCCESSSLDRTTEAADAYYDDDDGYYSPALDMDCSARPNRRTLYIEYWSRTEECKERKWDHLDEIAETYGAAEDHIFATTLNGRTAFLEPNMFPYDTPPGIEHWTLWHIRDLNHEQIKQYVENWIDANAPHVQRWNYDDNPERSIDIFHVHVYLQVGDDDTVLQGRKVESLLHECD